MESTPEVPENENENEEEQQRTKTGMEVEGAPKQQQLQPMSLFLKLPTCEELLNSPGHSPVTQPMKFIAPDVRLARASFCPFSLSDPERLTPVLWTSLGFCFWR